MSAVRIRPHAWYALRRTLPPWSFEKNLKELVRDLPRMRVDEVIVKVDVELFSHGHPTYEWLKAYQPRLFRLKRAMEKLGIVYSVNPWVTQGHSDRGWRAEDVMPGVQTYVGHDGAQSTGCACPLSQPWLDHVARLWTLYAETTPHIVWVEDDIRTFNHGASRHGCFCPLHLKRFSEMIGRKVTREELVAAILKPGKPHPWRAKWLDFQAEIMIDVVAMLARTVHRTSPETCMGLMSSGPMTHCTEGRRWRAFAEALADGRTLYSRPPMGNYREVSMRGLYTPAHTIQSTRHVLPAGTIEQTEVENVPFTQYGNSHTFTFLKMALSFGFGSHAVTMNLYDHAGTPMALDAGMGRMLSAKKRFLDALARRCQTPGAYRGVRILFDEKASFHKRLSEKSDYAALSGEGFAMEQALQAHGIPVAWDKENVVATSGQTLRGFSDDEIREMLSGGMLLDAVAASVLCERGFGKQIGLAKIAPPRCIDDIGQAGAEEFFNRKFGGASRAYMTTRLGGKYGRPQISVMTPLPGAQVVSRFVNADTNPVADALIAFENNLGGRVAVHGYDLEVSFDPVSFCHPFRAMQLQGIVRWLSRNKPALFTRGGAYPLTFRKDCGPFTVLGLFNLTLDAWESAEFELAERRTPTKVEVLSPSGTWQANKAARTEHSAGRLLVKYGEPVAHDQPLFVTLHFA